MRYIIARPVVFKLRRLKLHRAALAAELSIYLLNFNEVILISRNRERVERRGARAHAVET